MPELLDYEQPKIIVQPNWLYYACFVYLVIHILAYFGINAYVLRSWDQWWSYLTEVESDTLYQNYLLMQGVIATVLIATIFCWWKKYRLGWVLSVLFFAWLTFNYLTNLQFVFLSGTNPFLVNALKVWYFLAMLYFFALTRKDLLVVFAIPNWAKYFVWGLMLLSVSHFFFQ